jgi:hypothetical protein
MTQDYNFQYGEYKPSKTQYMFSHTFLPPIQI